MKNVVKNRVEKVFNKYIYNVVLTLIIFILFYILGYSKENADYQLYINNNNVNVLHGIYTKNNAHYMHIDDMTSIFSNCIYYDKISGKIIITSYDKILKINTDDYNYILKQNNNVYLNLTKTMEYIGNNIAVSKNKIYVLDVNCIEGLVQNNRVELYDIENNRVIGLLQKNQQLKVYVDDNLKNNTKNVINVEAIVHGVSCYGYVLRNNVKFEYKNTNEVINTKKIVLVKSEEKLSSNTDNENIDMVAVNMYRLSGVNTLTKVSNTTNVSGIKKIIAAINNGQKASNYDQDIVTRMLNSESNREQIIKQIIAGVKNLSGVNLDFANLKISDKQNYTQFIKELAVFLHQNNKILIVNIPNTQYIDVEQVCNVADYIVLQSYYARTASSKTSGPISSITYVEEYLKDILSKKINTNKVILEIPTYTILWTERRGTVINAEQYSMKMMMEYIKQNNIKTMKDGASGQNYINYTQGITTYKMWLEDEYSIIKKTEFANKYNLAGLSIYKSGMEEQGIYKKIKKVLDK